MIFKNKSKFNRGFSLVEILVGTSIICVSLLLIVNLESGVSRIGYSSAARVQAGMLAEEGIVAVQNMRNRSWDMLTDLSNDTPYHIVWNDNLGTWSISFSPILIDNKFDRTITFYEVKRDSSSFDITSSTGPGSVTDVGTRKFTINVAWDSGFGTSTKSMTSYIYNIYK